jgi:hypothetical protein
MPTMRRNGEALVATVLVLAAMAPPARAVGAFGSACQKDTDCDTGLCNVYFTVRACARRAGFGCQEQAFRHASLPLGGRGRAAERDRDAAASRWMRFTARSNTLGGPSLTAPMPPCCCICTPPPRVRGAGRDRSRRQRRSGNIPGSGALLPSRVAALAPTRCGSA